MGFLFSWRSVFPGDETVQLGRQAGNMSAESRLGASLHVYLL